MPKKKNFLDINTDSPGPDSLTFASGFKFGLGLFIAWLLGMGVLAVIAYFILKALNVIA